MGIRAAIGATPSMLIRGVAEGLIFGFDARDLRTFPAAILVTGGASLIALLHPALRAARTAPR